jgi:hypothetical protein
VAGLWFSPISSTNKTDCQDITEITMKVVLNTIKQTKKHIFEVKIFIVGSLLASLPMFAL